jgi:small subunit ribosomal protein S16
VVVADSRKRQGGSILELVGFFNPVSRGKEVRLKLELERIDHWVGLGAQLSDRVNTLVKDFRKQSVATAAAA